MTEGDPIPSAGEPIPPMSDPLVSPPPIVPYDAEPGAIYTGPAATPDAKTMGMLANLLNFTFLAPLLIYLLKKDEHPFIADQAKESLNFALCCLIIQIICSLTAFLCVPVLVAAAVLVLQIVFGIMGGLKARDGIAYRYPLNFRMIK